MAGDWIKMRGSLLEHPKLITLSKLIHENREFRDWLTPGGGGPVNRQVISDGALRYVTCAALLRVWSIAREHGKFVGNDLVLEYSDLNDLDQMGGCPGLGEAMSLVGWADMDGKKIGVLLPNFKEFNVPMNGAERQKRYRESALRTVTEPLRVARHIPVTREEKRREDIKTPLPPLGGDGRANEKANAELRQGIVRILFPSLVGQPDQKTARRLAGLVTGFASRGATVQEVERRWKRCQEAFPRAGAEGFLKHWDDPQIRRRTFQESEIC